MKPGELLGRSPDNLSIQERTALRGQWIAMPVYSPETLPLRRIVAIGRSPADCMQQIAGLGLDPTTFEYTLVSDQYQ
jgi:hypothetical protein